MLNMCLDLYVFLIFILLCSQVRKREELSLTESEFAANTTGTKMSILTRDYSYPADVRMPNIQEKLRATRRVPNAIVRFTENIFDSTLTNVPTTP